MKRAFIFLFMLTLLLGLCVASPLQANAATYTEGDYTYSVLYDEKAQIEGYSGPGGDITIPATLGGYPVTAISSRAFEECASLISVTIPDSVQAIGNWAFCDCDSLITVNLPDSVQTIGIYAFAYCDSLTGIWVAGNNPNYSSDDRGVLFDKSQTLLIQAPGALSGNYTVPNCVQSIDKDAFLACARLTGVTIGNSLQTIGKYAFEGCTSLTGVYITDVAAWCKIDFKSSYANPLRYAHNLYLNGTLVTELIIPDGVQSISNGAFCDCNSLITVNVPDSVQYIGNLAFTYCDSLTGIWVAENNPDYSSDDRGILFDKNKTRLIQAPGAISNNYAIPDGVQAIGEHAFSGCANLASVAIGNNVQIIGDFAFYSCDSLTTVTIPDSVETIRWGTFSECTSLTMVTIGKRVRSIEDYAFDSCYSLSTVTIPDSVQTVGDKAFQYCDNLTVYYGGTEDQWKQIDIGSLNWALIDATIHYSHVHDYSVVPPVTVAATCSQEGYIEYTCVHGETYREVLPRLSHSYPEQPTVVAPTCTQEGYTCVTCSLCGHEERTDIVPALGHSFADGVCTICGAPDAVPGELDGDGEVSESDAIYLLQYILMPDLFQVSQDADFDKDGEVNEDDAIYLLQHILMPDLFPL